MKTIKVFIKGNKKSFIQKWKFITCVWSYKDDFKQWGILNKCHDKNQHTYASNSLWMYILELVLYKKILLLYLWMYFIIIHSGNFDDFLSVNIMLCKEKKLVTLNHYMLLWA